MGLLSSNPWGAASSRRAAKGHPQGALASCVLGTGCCQGWGLWMVRDTWRQPIDFHCIAVSLNYRKLQASEQLDLNHLTTVQQKKPNHAGSQLGLPVNQSNCRSI